MTVLASVEDSAPTARTDHPFETYANPRLARVLGQLMLDKSYVRGEGCYLFDSSGKRYLDFLAQYGALPFGFNHPRIWNAIEQLRDSMEPSFVQPSLLNPAGELAERLVKAAPEGLNRVTFANSGAEAVEAAIKLCRSATGRHKILAASNGFHGKTLGALSATDKPKYQKAFGAPVPGFDYVAYGDAAALEKALAGKEYAGFFVEALQGEGGIVEPPEGYLKRVEQICKATGTLFVADEIQTGLGRTGVLFACDAAEVSPDVMTVAKALGGGMVPIGAVLARGEYVTDDFALKHTSTFAGNALACRVGLATLDLLEENNHALIRDVARHGAYLRDRLLWLQNQYPGLIEEVRGRGFMLGVKFGLTRDGWMDSLLGCLGETEFFTPLVVTYMLNRHGVRLGYTLNQGGILRIQPPLTAGREECDLFLRSFEEMLVALARRDTAAFTAHITGFDSARTLAPRSRSIAQATGRKRAGDGRFAFLFHPLTIRNYADADSTLQALSEPQLGKLAACVGENFDPFVVGEAVVEARSGKRAHGDFIVVPHTAEEMVALPHRDAIAEIRMAAELARSRGAEIIGLGGFVSVVTRGGLYLKGTGLPALTTGNSYTSVAGRLSIEAALARQGRGLGDCTVAIVGATGSIGRALALMLAGRVRRLVLIGNPSHPRESMRRLVKIAAETGYVERVVTTCDSAEWLPQSDVIVTATSATGEIVKPGDLAPGAVVCDISRPPNVDRGIREIRPDVTILDGGVIRLPEGSSMSFRIDIDPGHVYACMAETMMLALEHRYGDTSLGLDLDLRQVLEFEDLSLRHGFEVAAAQRN